MILTKPKDFEIWMTAQREIAADLQRPLSEGAPRCLETVSATWIGAQVWSVVIGSFSARVAMFADG
ncbi:hypothetical protein [Brevundimonas sp.]|uniref:hypothetical protein n=1 Tax=Brevundimonas sp. TaxID=1871086 RepID=UPI0025BF44F6|nr:hypothetical protein [Brevundimonas sp.]